MATAIDINPGLMFLKIIQNVVLLTETSMENERNEHVKIIHSIKTLQSSGSIQYVQVHGLSPFAFLQILGSFAIFAFTLHPPFLPVSPSSKPQI